MLGPLGLFVSTPNAEKSPQEDACFCSLNLRSVFFVVAAICLTVLMFNTYLSEFVVAGEAPLMSEQEFRILYSILPISAILPALCVPHVIDRFGPALCSVFGNAVTSGLLVALLLTTITATETTFVICAVILCTGFPVGFLSNLCASPMLDRIAPSDQRGSLQGLAVACMDFASAIATFLLGISCDTFGTRTTLWNTAGICLVAALINAQLISNPRLKKPLDE